MPDNVPHIPARIEAAESGNLLKGTSVREKASTVACVDLSYRVLFKGIQHLQTLRGKEPIPEFGVKYGCIVRRFFFLVPSVN
jgi:hypothetical protein